VDANANAPTEPSVTIAERVYTLDPATPFVFGRSDVEGVVGLDPDDTGISRRAGQLAFRNGWLLVNESMSRPLMVEFPRVVRRRPVAPGEDLHLSGPALVLVPGANLTHALEVTIPPEPSSLTHAPRPAAQRPTNMDLITQDDHLALIALGEGYLRRWPRHDPKPCSYEDAAARLGVSTTSLRRRIDRLREHTANRGNFVAAGPHALRELVEYYIDTGWLGVDDVQLLPERRRLAGEATAQDG
jgi:hypothetical protein